jgi:uncharacterized protein with von Willebrand factor type A (vWA) domain
LQRKIGVLQSENDQLSIENASRDSLVNECNALKGHLEEVRKIYDIAKKENEELHTRITVMHTQMQRLEIVFPKPQPLQSMILGSVEPN